MECGKGTEMYRNFEFYNKEELVLIHAVLSFCKMPRNEINILAYPRFSCSVKGVSANI